MKETARYVGPDGEALHPGDRIGLEPPGCLKRDDRLDAWLTALRHELARACELPEKAMFGDDLPDDLPQDDGGLGIWQWLGPDAIKIKNPELMILGKDDMKMFGDDLQVEEDHEPETGKADLEEVDAGRA